MHDHYPTVVSTRDHCRLQAMMCTMIGSRTSIANLLRRKLGSAVIMLPNDIAHDVVTPGRRVRFTIDGYRSEVRLLGWGPPVPDANWELSLLLPRGLALLGLSVGQSISYTTAARRTEYIEIDFVFPDDDDPVLHAEPFRDGAVVLHTASHSAPQPFGSVQPL